MSNSLDTSVGKGWYLSDGYSSLTDGQPNFRPKTTVGTAKPSCVSCEMGGAVAAGVRPARRYVQRKGTADASQALPEP